jgi:hypothetical protein
LEKISHHIPDEEINLLFPFKKFNTQGRSREFKTSQLYRAHILAMLKRQLKNLVERQRIGISRADRI